MLAVTNNLLFYVGSIALFFLILGALYYVIGGINESAKSKGKDMMIWSLIGAAVSWSAWFLVNFLIDTR